MDSPLRSAADPGCGHEEAIHGGVQRSRGFRSASGWPGPGHRGFVPRSSEESGGWLMIEVAGEGVAESPARGREVVAGEGGGVGGRHDARVGD